MKKVNDMEMRNVEGGRRYWCKICEYRGLKRKYYNNWFTATCHAWGTHSADGSLFLKSCW